MADGNIAEQRVPADQQIEYQCCGVCCPVYHPPAEITASSDQITVDAECAEDLDVFVSSLTTPPPGGIEQDLGLISVIVGKIRNVRITQQQRQQMVNGRGVGTFQLKQLEADMAEMERARGLAFAKLRRKAKRMDANAILNVKVDLETAGQASIVYASGNAVILKKPQGSGSALWGGSDLPPYLPWAEAVPMLPERPTSSKLPLSVEMQRDEAKGGE